MILDGDTESKVAERRVHIKVLQSVVERELDVQICCITLNIASDYYIVTYIESMINRIAVLKRKLKSFKLSV